MKEINNGMNSAKSLENFDLDAFASSAKEGMETKKHQDEINGMAPLAPDEQYDEVKRIVDMLVSSHTDITTSYQDWLHLGFALANGLGEQGRELYHQLSSMNADYNPTECDKKYTSCMKGSGQGITLGTFFSMAKDAGIDLGEIARQRLRENGKKTDTTSIVSATSAILPPAKKIGNIGKSAYLSDFGIKMARGRMAEVAETSPAETTQGSAYVFSDKVKIEDLPSILQPIAGLHPDTVSIDKMLLGCLAVVSGIMGGTNGTGEEKSGIYGIYDGRCVYAPLYTLLYGSAATKKGDLLFCKSLLRPVKLEMRREYEAAKTQYEQELATYEAQGKGKTKAERGPAPKEPVFLDPFLPGNSSASAVCRQLEANGGWGMIFETEADTVSNMIDSDYGNYSDMLRKAYHHETISMSRVSDKIHIDIENPRLSVFITCTPGQLMGLFPSFENGLGSRFQFYSLPDDKVEFHDVFALNDTSLEETYKLMGEKLLPLYHALKERKGNPIQFVLSAAQKAEFLSTFREVLIEQFKMLGSGINAFIFRMALANFRYAMVLTALRHLSEWNEKDDLFPAEERALVCDDRDFHTAMQIVGCLIYHTAKVYAVLAKESENPFANHGVKLSHEELAIFKSLPEGEFRTADFLGIAKERSISDRTAARMLGQMCHVHRIIRPVRRGVYSKSVIQQE